MSSIFLEAMKEIIINITGNLDPVNGSDLYLKIKELISTPHKIILDMNQLKGVDEVGIVYLQKIQEKIIYPSSIAVCCVPENMIAVLQQSENLNMPFFSNRKEAIKFLSTEAVQDEVQSNFCYCPSCGVDLVDQEGNIICPGCNTKLYVHSGRATAFERLF